MKNCAQILNRLLVFLHLQNRIAASTLTGTTAQRAPGLYRFGPTFDYPSAVCGVEEGDTMTTPSDALVEKLKTVSLFESLSEDALLNIASHLEPVEFGPHDRIIRQGDFGDKFYIIEEGQVEVYVHGAFIVNLKEGTFFGEQALLKNAPRNASIVAAENGCKCLQMSRSNFEKFLGPLRQLMDRVNERRQLLMKRKKMMKSKLGSRMAALDRLINPDLAAELDAQDAADKKGGHSKTPSKRKDSNAAKPKLRKNRSGHTKEANRGEAWEKAVKKEREKVVQIQEANQELLRGAAMSRQTTKPMTPSVVHEALKSGTALVTRNSTNVAPPPPPPRRHALRHDWHSWVVWEGCVHPDVILQACRTFSLRYFDCRSLVTQCD